MANLKPYIYLSIFLHLAFIFAFMLFSFVTKNNEDLSYVEVSFGLNQNLVSTHQFEDKKISEGEQLALKAKDRLPQLTKNSAPIVSQSQEKDDIVKARDDNNTQLQNEKSANLEMKDFLKRKEEILRKTGEKSQIGQKEVDKTKKVGHQPSRDIPRSPFETVKIPKTQNSEAPTGIESGTNKNVFNMYVSYLYNQLKLNWNIPEITKFPPTLATKVSITVNEFGHLIGHPKIIASSKNNEFDRLVVEAVIATFPVSNPPPKDIHPPQTFNLNFTSRDLK